MNKPKYSSLARSPNSSETLKIAPDAAALPERLMLAHAKGRLLFIAGAGISMQAPSCLPNFVDLVKRVFTSLDGAMGEHIRNRGNPSGLQNLPLPALDPEQEAALRCIYHTKQYDMALGMLERRIDVDQDKSGRVRRKVRDELIKATGHAPVHEALLRLADRGGNTTLLTTNFDLLFESADRKLNRNRRLPRYALQDLPRPSLQPEFSGILHLHGALDPDPDRHADLLLTDRDFGEYYLRRRSIPDFIYDAARIFHIVLVGYGANDPPMSYLLNAVAADERHFPDLKERFAFVGMKAPFDTTDLAHWKGRGITPIPYDEADDHKSLAVTLQAWAELSPHGNGRSADKILRKTFSKKRANSDEQSASLFGHLVRRSSWEGQAKIAHLGKKLNADPAWLDGIIEVVNELRVNNPNSAHIINICRAFIYNRYKDLEVMRWATQLSSRREAERAAVKDVTNWHLPSSLQKPWREAWR